MLEFFAGWALAVGALLVGWFLRGWFAQNAEREAFKAGQAVARANYKPWEPDPNAVPPTEAEIADMIRRMDEDVRTGQRQDRRSHSRTDLPNAWPLRVTPDDLRNGGAA